MIDNDIYDKKDDLMQENETGQKIDNVSADDPVGGTEDADTTPQNDADDLEALRNKYLRGGKGGKASFVRGYEDKTQLITNIILLCAVILTTLCSVIWFATPTMKLGGTTYNGKTQNIFSFLFFGKNSMLEEIKVAVKNVKNIESDAFSAITSATRMVRLIVIGICGIIVLLQTVINTVAAIVHFTKHNAIGLRAAAVNNVAFKLAFYVCLAFFGSMSGGSGDSAYYHGYSAGVGMTVGLVLSMCGLIAVVVLTYLKKHKTATAEDKEQFYRSVVSCVGYTVIGIMLALMNMFGVFMYAITSITQAIAYTVQYSFKFNVILFPLLNIVIYAACIIIYKRTVMGFTNSFAFLMTFDSNALINTCKPKKLKKFKKLLSLSFTIPAVLSALALIATLLLGIPSIGFGWSFDFYPYLIVIMTVACVGQIVLSVLLKPIPQLPPQPKRTKEATQTN